MILDLPFLSLDIVIQISDVCFSLVKETNEKRAIFLMLSATKKQVHSSLESALKMNQVITATVKVLI